MATVPYADEDDDEDAVTDVYMEPPPPDTVFIRVALPGNNLQVLTFSFSFDFSYKFGCSVLPICTKLYPLLENHFILASVNNMERTTRIKLWLGEFGQVSLIACHEM